MTLIRLCICMMICAFDVKLWQKQIFSWYGPNMGATVFTLNIMTSYFLTVTILKFGRVHWLTRGCTLPDGMAHSVNPDQTAPSGAVWSGFTQFDHAHVTVRIFRVNVLFQSIPTHALYWMKTILNQSGWSNNSLFCKQYSIYIYILNLSKTATLKDKKLVFKTNYRLMQVKSTAIGAIISTFIKLPFVIMIFVLSIFE